MKIKILLFAFFMAVSLQLLAQERSPFRAGYIRLGLNTLGNDLDYNLSPKANVFNGNYGAGTGYVFEFGHIFYFKNRSQASNVNFGLDWTVLSLNYNQLKKWDDYAAASGVGDFYIDGSKTAAAASSKLGPVISFSPGGGLVIDARFQVAPMFRFYDLTYSENEGKANERYFSFTNYAREDADDNYDAESVKNRISFGVATSFGATIRYKAIGLSVDYITGKVKSNYDAIEGSSVHTNGKESIPAHNLQLKLSLTL